jgi:hypothetical protein
MPLNTDRGTVSFVLLRSPALSPWRSRLGRHLSGVALCALLAFGGGGSPARQQPFSTVTVGVLDLDPIDDAIVGTTPLLLPLPEGSYRVKLSRAGYGSVTRTVEVKGGRPTEVSIQLQVLPPPG